MNGATGALAGMCICLSLSLVGCRPQPQQIAANPDAVAELELVARGVDHSRYHTDYRGDALAAVRAHPIPVRLPPGSALRATAQGREYLAVTAEQSRSGWLTETVWLTNARGGLRGQLDLGPVGAEQQRSVELAWNAEGHRLAALVVLQGAHELSQKLFVFDSPSLRARCTFALPPGTIAVPAVPLWAGRFIILVTSGEDGNAVVRIDPSKCQTDVLYAERTSSSGKNPPFGGALVSPDGKRLALARLRLDPRGSGDYGLSVLDLQTRGYAALTNDGSRGEAEFVVRWESPTRLLFLRWVPSDQPAPGRHDLYRLVLRPVAVGSR